MTSPTFRFAWRDDLLTVIVEHGGAGASAGCDPSDAMSVRAAVDEIVEQMPSLDPAGVRAAIEAERQRRAPAGFRFQSPFDLGQQPPRKLLWRAGLGVGELGLLFAQWGSYKSFIAKGLAVAIADGAEFLGHRTIQGDAVYICGEGAAGIADRLKAATSAARMADPDDPLHQRLGVACAIPPLTEREGFDAIVQAIEARSAVPALLIVDTLSRALGAAGLDENSSADMSAMICACDRLRQRFAGMAILLVHHTGTANGDRGRGSSVLPAACDWQARLEAAPGVGIRPVTLHCVKTKEGAPFQPIEITMESVVVRTDDEGQPITSLRVAGFRSATEQPKGKQPTAAERLLDALNDAGEGGLSFNGAKSATTKVASTTSDALAKLVAAGMAEPFVDDAGRKAWRRVS